MFDYPALTGCDLQGSLGAVASNGGRFFPLKLTPEYFFSWVLPSWIYNFGVSPGVAEKERQGRIISVTTTFSTFWSAPVVYVVPLKQRGAGLF